jgi:hypothetical protein
VLHTGQELMFDNGGDETLHGLARWRPFVCVGLAYFVIGVVVPLILLKTVGEKGQWTASGAIWSLAAGAFGALGALGIILAFKYGGKPIYVMPLVFGGAPVVNSFLTIYWARKMSEISTLFTTGLVMVLLGAVTVLVFAPTAQSADASSLFSFNGVLQILSIALVIVCWGAYGPVLHKGQARMDNSRLRPLLCVGLAYFAIAVIVPNLILPITGEASSYWQHAGLGSLWSLGAGAAGAFGALGIIMAFNFGGKPVFVMPLVFGGAPVVNTLYSGWASGKFAEPGAISPVFIAGIILAAAGAAMVLVFAPKGKPPVAASSTPPKTVPDTTAGKTSAL